MRVLLTGSFGNIGKSTLIALVESNHEISCFDLPSRKNKRLEAKLRKKFTFHTIWGNILDNDVVAKVVNNQECIIHLAGITPPATENNPELAYQINVQGTKNVVKEALKQKKLPKISVGTVYRNLDVLTDQKLIRRIDIPNEPVRFDADQKNKAYFVCKNKGAIYDLNIDPEKVKKLISECECIEEINDFHILLFGTSKDCPSERGMRKGQLKH